MNDKNRRKAEAKLNRVWFDMNTGTRVHKDPRHPSRNDCKQSLKRMLDKEY